MLSEWLKIYFGPSDYRALRAFRRVGIVPSLVGWPTSTRNHIAAVNNVRSRFFVKTTRSKKYVEDMQTLPLDLDSWESNCHCSHCAQTCDCFRRRDAPPCHSHCRANCSECGFTEQGEHTRDKHLDSCDCEDCHAMLATPIALASASTNEPTCGERTPVDRVPSNDHRRRFPVRRCTTVTENSVSNFSVDRSRTQSPKWLDDKQLKHAWSNRSDCRSQGSLRSIEIHRDSPIEHDTLSDSKRGARRISVVSFTPTMPLVARHSLVTSSSPDLRCNAQPIYNAELKLNEQHNPAIESLKKHHCEREHATGNISSHTHQCNCSNEIPEDEEASDQVEMHQYRTCSQQLGGRKLLCQQKSVDGNVTPEFAGLESDEKTFSRRRCVTGGMDSRRKPIGQFMSIDALDSTERNNSPQSTSEDETRGHSDSGVVKRERCHSMLVLASPSDDGNVNKIDIDPLNKSLSCKLTTSRTEVHLVEEQALRERNEMLEERVQQLEKGMRKLSVTLTGQHADCLTDIDLQNQTNSRIGEYPHRSTNDGQTLTLKRDVRLPNSLDIADPLVMYDASLEAHYHSNSDRSPLSSRKSPVHEQISTVASCQMSPTFDQLAISADSASEDENMSSHTTTVLMLDSCHLKSRYQ